MMINEKQKVGFTDQVQVIDEILGDAWLYENLHSVNNGAWAFGYNSKFNDYYKFRDQTVLSYESGWLTNQSWAANNQTYTAGTPEVSIGYTFWTESPDQIYLNSTSEMFQFPIDSFSFGQLNYKNDIPSSGYFEALSNETTVTIALNAKGLGLPYDMFMELSTMLNNITEAYCLNETGGFCYLLDACEAVPALWDL